MAVSTAGETMRQATIRVLKASVAKKAWVLDNRSSSVKNITELQAMFETEQAALAILEEEEEAT